MIKVAVSGGFDPLHDCHIDHMQEAKKLGDWLVVIVNTDEFLIRKKGFIFQPLLVRLRKIIEYSFVDQYVVCIDRDDTVAETLRLLRPDKFAKGGDRDPAKVPIPQNEIVICKEIGCEIVYGVDRGVRASSSSEFLESIAVVDKPWGYEKVLATYPGYTSKILHINQGESLSEQVHKARLEYWRVNQGFPLVQVGDKEDMCKPGDVVIIPPGVPHRAKAVHSFVQILETALPEVSGEDIVRLQDEYGRVDAGH